MSKKHKNNYQNSSSGKRKSKAKTYLMVFAVLVAFLCVACIGWYVWLLTTASKREVDHTGYVGDLTLSDGTKVPIIEVKYFKNADNSGIEMLDVKFNSLLDENDKDNVYTYGIQLTSSNNISFGIETDKYGARHLSRFGWSYDWHVGGTCVCTGTSINYYEGANGVFGATSADKFSKNMSIKLNTTDNQIYKLKFADVVIGERNQKWQGDPEYYASNGVAPYLTTAGGIGRWTPIDNYRINHYYWLQPDPMYLVKCIYDSIKGSAAGTKHSQVLSWHDGAFELYKHKGNSVYDERKVDDTTLVKNITHDYISFDVTTIARGANKASDSLFGWVQGNQAYNTSGSVSTTEYEYGNSVINVTLDDCDLVETATENVFELKLTEAFLKTNEKYKKISLLNINIDASELQAKGAQITGFTKEGLAGWNYYYSNIGGENNV